jgi:hypothetical protein
MSILDKVVKIEKHLDKLAGRRGVPASPIEIRRAILDDIEEHVQPAGRARRVFPYDQLLVEVLTALPDRAAVEAVLSPDEGLVEAIRERLHEAGCERVGRLHVTVKLLRKARPGWEPGGFQITYERTEGGAAREAETPPGADRESAVAGKHAQLVVVEGEATRKTYTLAGERVNVGRLAEVTDKDRRVVRRNHVVFLETESETNQTVSRAQAHISITPSGEFRLFDDRSSYGTRVVREGRMIELPSGSPRGVKLRSGDEIYFGRARVQFLVK